MKIILPGRTQLMPIIFVAMFSIFGNCHAGEDMRWHAKGMELIAEIEILLIERGQCAPMSECTKKGKTFFRSTRNGLEISLYSTADSTVISLVLAKLAMTLATEKMQEIQLNVFANTKSVEMQRAGWFGERQSMSFSLRGDYVTSDR